MLSSVDIANMALSFIGVESIETFSEASPAAKQLTLFYPTTLEEILREGCWNFCKKTVTLALTNNTDAEWAYVYEYPTDCIKALRVINPEHGTYSRQFDDQREQYNIGLSQDNTRLIQCNVRVAKLEYIANVTDVALFSSDFVEAFSLKLASKISHQLTGNPNLAMNFLQMYMSSVQNAMTRAANESNSPTKQESQYARARL